MAKLIRFETWMNQIKWIMERKGLIKPETILDKNGYKPYWEDGLDVWSALDAEFGKNWRALVNCC